MVWAAYTANASMDVQKGGSEASDIGGCLVLQYCSVCPSLSGALNALSVSQRYNLQPLQRSRLRPLTQYKLSAASVTGCLRRPDRSSNVRHYSLPVVVRAPELTA